jgi:hypothetical protein
MGTDGEARYVSRLQLRMGTPGTDSAGGLVYPVARILIDGRDIFADAGRSGLIGWPAGTLLSDDLPLLPAEPRRVIVCVSDPDPVGLAPVISAHGSVVTWTDFRDFWEVEDSPFLAPGTRGGTPVELPDLAFDASQYTTEVRRATAAREWESDGWRTAILLDQNLPAWASTPDTTWHLCFAEPDGDERGRFLVTYLEDTTEQREITVALTAGHGTPEDKAREMAAFLQSMPTGRWPVIRRLADGGG